MCASIVILKTSVGGRVKSDIRPGNFHATVFREEARVAARFMYCNLPTYSRVARSPFFSLSCSSNVWELFRSLPESNVPAKPSHNLRTECANGENSSSCPAPTSVQSEYNPYTGFQLLEGAGGEASSPTSPASPPQEFQYLTHLCDHTPHFN